MSIVCPNKKEEDTIASANNAILFMMHLVYVDVCFALLGMYIYQIFVENSYRKPLFFAMVNSSAMNIDVREYLRINPISVHDLSLSGNGQDCFLVFGNEIGNGYRAVTQNVVFRELLQRIFGDLLNSDMSGFNLSSTEPPEWNPCDLRPDQFSDYVRRNGADHSAYNPYKIYMESWLSGIESAVEDKIWQLRLKAKTWSRGSVEYKANSSTPYYENEAEYGRLTGITWCYDQSGGDFSEPGLDLVEMAEPVKHGHPDSRAETFTVPYSTKKGGGQLIAECGIGVKDMVSYSDWDKTTSSLVPKQEMELV